MRPLALLLLAIAWLAAAAPAQAKPRDGVLRMVPSTYPEDGIYTISGSWRESGRRASPCAICGSRG